MADNARISAVAWGTLEGQRPREARCNARLGVHGLTVSVPLLQITTDDGSSGFGACRTTEEQASALLGKSVNDLFSPSSGVNDNWLPFEFAIWDLIGQRTGLPVYALTASIANAAIDEPFNVPCYDTSLYIDDLHLESEVEAAAYIADEAREGYARGHRNFKIKVGRGGRHMPVDEGTARDIAVIRAVREAVGAKAAIMIDANNGYNLNLTKRVLAETADCNIFWVEEAFHEDPVLYEDLKSWQQKEGLTVLIADGEGLASPRLLDWAQDGLIDVIQYDIFGYGLMPWLRTGHQLDAWDVRSAPHHYGRHIGNYVSCHLASAITGFTFTEWDEVTTPGLDAPGYSIADGHVSVPNSPGFGLMLDQSAFAAATSANGFEIKV